MITIDIFNAFKRDKLLGFNLIYRVCQKPLAKFAFRLTHRTDVAEDVVAEAFLLLWKKRRKFKNELHIQRFLYLTVFNCCQTERRELRKCFTELPEDLDQIDPDGSELALLKEFTAHNQWIVDKIRLHLEELPPQRAQDFYAFIFELKSYKEIARERGTAVDTVRMNVRLATREIQKYLETNRYPGYSKNS